MASTTFSDGQSIIYSSWLNDVNTAVYTGVFPNGTLSLTNLSVSGSVSGSGFTTLVNNTLSAPGAIGSVTPNTGAFTTLTASTPIGVASGGTGLNSITANSVLLGNGTGALQRISPSTTGNVLTSNGTSWVSQAPAAPVFSSIVYTNVTGSRSPATTYTNSTGKSMIVNIGFISNGAGQITVNGNLAASCPVAGGVSGFVSAVVPNGATYSLGALSGGYSYTWIEGS